METKLFSEVFPTLQLNSFQTRLLSNVKVTRVASALNGSCLRIYIQSSTLLNKQDLLSVQKAIKEQLFKNVPVEVRIIESFQLQKHYTLPVLWKEYKSSVIYELQEENPLEAQMLECADVTVTEDGSFLMSLEESRLFHLTEKELRERLQFIFTERCAVDARVRIVYHEPAQIEQPDDVPMQPDSFSTADYIEEKYEAAEQKTAAPEQKMSEPEQKPSVQDRKDSGNNHKKTGYRKKSPDVIYGRDFDDEAVPISSLTEEMDAAVVR